MSATSTHKSAAYADIKKAIRHNRSLTEKKTHDTEYYNVDRVFAFSYFECDWRSWADKVRDFLDELRANGQPLVYVDVCGSALLERADANYCFRLFKRFLDGSNQTVTEGDIFRMKDFYSFLRSIRRNGHRPSFVTFSPIVGLQAYTPFHSKQKAALHAEVTHRRLGNNLRKTIDLLQPGGYIFLDRPFQFAGVEFFSTKPATEEEISLQIQSVCKDMRCTVSIMDTMFGPKFLIRKRKTRKAAQTRTRRRKA